MLSALKSLKNYLSLVKFSHTIFAMPFAIIGFVLASCLFSFFPNFIDIYTVLYKVSKQMMVVSLFLIGSGISLANIKSIGQKVVIQAVGIWVIVCLLSLYYVTHFQI